MLPGLLGVRMAVLALTALEPGAEPSGDTIEYAYDEPAHADLAWSARAYVAPEVRADRPVPLVIFLHGTNRQLVKHPWMGGGGTDLRAAVGRMIAARTIEPVVLAAPSSVVPDQVQYTSWAGFDLDDFVARTVAALGPRAAIDPSRIVLAGHSGAGCHEGGGIASAATANQRLRAVLAIDTCMYFWLAERLAKLPADTHVVVTYQTVTWQERPFDDFATVFRRAAAESAQGAGRIVEELRPESPDPHAASVTLSLERWLPRVLGAAPAR